jgi:hypothetical protein
MILWKGRLLELVSHVFCCVLPTIVSLIGLFAALGFLSTYLTELEIVHEALHDYEGAILLASGLILTLGWGAHYYSEKMDCHDNGCHHGPCKPQKKRATKILMAATGLFILNIILVLYIG